MAYPLVSLIAGTVLAAAATWAQGFPPIGGFGGGGGGFGGRGGFGGMGGGFGGMGGGFGGMGGGFGGIGGGFGGGFGDIGGFGGLSGTFNRGQQQNTANPNLLTCINADTQDPTSQIRLSIRPLDTSSSSNPFSSAFGGFGFGGLGGDLINRDQPQTWEVSGVLLTSSVVSKAGTYEVGAFEGGRTHGTCQSAALGQLIQPRGFGGLGPFGTANPFLQQQQGSVVGAKVTNPAFISGQGPTIYTGLIRDVTYHQLVGGSIGVCQAIQNNNCIGTIPFCCSITKDLLSADQVYVDANHNQPGVFGGVGGFAVGGAVGGGLSSQSLGGVGGGTVGGAFGGVGGGLRSDGLL